MSDKTEEKLEIYSKDGKPTGTSKARGKIHSDGDYHKAVKIWNVNSKGEVLIQQRVFTKKSYPGMWDATAAGHIVFGETSLETASKEFEEELGIKVEEKEFQYLFTTTIESILNNGSFINNEFLDNYLLEKDIDVKDLKLQEVEVNDAKYVHYSVVEKMILEKDKSFICNPEYLKVINAIREKNYPSKE
eukprot:gene10084-2506_t